MLAIAAIAGLAYAWGMNGAALETFYGAAARSMSTSWHDFFFGAFDPQGTMSVDKLPGGLWPQALVLRLLGFHVWAVVLPQVVEGVITVLVLFRVMCRLAGPVAGLTAAAVLAATPVTVGLNRGNVSDSLLILLTVLAADATVAALIDGRLRPLLLAGVWTGLAFQTKMMQAWLILPALAIAYLVAAPPRVRVRVSHVALAGLVTLAVSVSWMSVVSLVPADERPYADGTQNDSLFSQVFEYNGFARLGRGTSLAGAGHRAEFLSQSSAGGADDLDEHIPPSWHRLLEGLYGRDIGWLLPAALLSGVAVLLGRRDAGRRDLLRASVLLWGAWLLVLWALFSDGVYLHSYYVAALAPAIAGLCGTGAAMVWSRWPHRSARQSLAVAVVISIAYGAYLLRGGVGVPAWLIPAAVCLGAACSVALLAVGAGARGRGAAAVAMVAATGCGLLLPAVASLSMVTRHLGPFAAPFEPASATQSSTQSGHVRAASARLVGEIAAAYRTPIVFATDTSRLASLFILASGREILPIGGFEGGIPAPTLTDLRREVSSGRLRAFLLPSSSSDPRLVWVYDHCERTGLETGGQFRLLLYACGSKQPSGGA